MSSLFRMSKTLESVVNYIRDILRKEGITGMDSINHCIAFVVCKMIDSDMCEKYGIDENYMYDNMMVDDDGNEIGNQELYDRFYSGDENSFIGQLYCVLGFKNIQFKLVGTINLKDIMKRLRSFDPKQIESNYDIIGTIYEIHLRSGTSNAMRDLGQYYTHRLVIEHMIKMCDPVAEDGEVETIVDPTMGTGGFLTMAIKYLNNKYGNIDWASNKDNIFGFDIDENVKNMALLNAFMETGELFADTICKQDTLSHDMTFSDGTRLEKVKIILANEPMGIKNINFSACCNRIRKDLKSGTKAEPLFLNLFMEALDEGGRCAVIVPDGVLFNDSTLHSSIRKKLVDKFNLKKIVALNDKFFLNTGVKTSIMFFVNDGTKTNEVVFSELKLNNGVLDENEIITVKYTDIKNSKYSLFVNKYNVKKQEQYGNVEYKMLGNLTTICSGVKCGMPEDMFCDDETQPKYIRIVNLYDNSIDGEYKYLSKKGCEKTKNNRFSTNDLYFSIVGTVGLCGIINNEFQGAVHSGNIVRLTEITDVLPKYLMYYLNSNECKIKIDEITTTTTQPATSINKIQELEIPIPDIRIQQKIVDAFEALNNLTKSCKNNIEMLKIAMKQYITLNTKNEQKCEMGAACSFLGKSTRNASFGTDDGVYNFYTSGANTKKCDVADYSDESIIVGTGGMASIKYDANYSCSADNFVAVSTDTRTVVIKYIYYYLQQNIDLLENGFKGSVIKHLSKEYLETLEIPLPSIEKQNKIVAYCDGTNDLINQLEKRIVENEEEMKSIIPLYLDMTEKTEEEVVKAPMEKQQEDDEPKIIKDGRKQYYLVGTKLYKIKKDKTCGALYGFYIDGKIVENK